MEKIIKKLDQLVIDYHRLFVKILNFHWNVKGKQFFELHEQLEEYYKDALEEYDRLAERIFMLGEEYSLDLKKSVEQTKIKKPSDFSNSKEMINEIVNDYDLILEELKSLSELADSSKDKGTANLADDLILNIEKRLWMLRSFRF